MILGYEFFFAAQDCGLQNFGLDFH